MAIKRICYIVLMLLASLSVLSLNLHAAEGDIVGPDVIYKESNRILTLSTILPLYSSSLGDVTIKQDAYTGFGDKPGLYSILLGVAGQTQEKNITVSVRNTIGNVIAVTKTDDLYTIVLHKNYVLTQNDIVNVLVNVQMITYTSTTEIFILTDTYTANRESPGLYAFEFHLANAAGYEEVYLVNIQVNNSEKLLPDIVETRLNFTTVVKNVFYIILSVLALVGVLILIAKLSKRAKARKGIFK